MKKILLNVIVISCAALPLTANAGPQERGMLTGAAIGATTGAVIGAETNETAEGAMIGAIFGAVAGALLSDLHAVPSRAQKPRRVYQTRHQYKDQYRHSPHKSRQAVKPQRKHQKRMHQQAVRGYKHHADVHFGRTKQRNSNYHGLKVHHYQRQVVIPTHKQQRSSHAYTNYRSDRASNHSGGKIRHYARAY